MHYFGASESMHMRQEQLEDGVRAGSDAGLGSACSGLYLLQTVMQYVSTQA